MSDSTRRRSELKAILLRHLAVRALDAADCDPVLTAAEHLWIKEAITRKVCEEVADELFRRAARLMGAS